LRNSEFLVAFVKLQEAHQIKSNSTQCETQGNPAIHIVFVFSVCSSQTNLDGPPTLLKKKTKIPFSETQRKETFKNYGKNRNKIKKQQRTKD